MVTTTNVPYHNHNPNQWAVDELHETYELAHLTIMAIMFLIGENQVRRFQFPLMLIYNDCRKIEYCQLRAVTVNDQVMIDVIRI